MAVSTLTRVLNTEQLDSAIEDLQRRADEWANLPLGRKIDLLKQVRDLLGVNAQSWVDESVKGKRINANSPAVGEEWASGPWAIAAALNVLIDTLKAVEVDTTPELKQIRTRADGQVVAQVYPANLYDILLTNGISAELWFNPTVTEDNLSNQFANYYKRDDHRGKVALVLGAGNINSIPPLDTLYKLFMDGEVVILKLNPVNDYLGPILVKIFKPFVDAGYFRVAYGGADVGAYLVNHEQVDTIHITGAASTHDVIVYGTGEEGRQRKADNRPLLEKPITSELGGVGPVIVVPGPWTAADIEYQAQRIASQKLHNNGCNCIAAQILVLPLAWDKSSQLLDAVREQFRTIPERSHYYPGAESRVEAAIDVSANSELINGRALISDLDPNNSAEYCFNTEFFSTALAQTYIDGSDPASYLRNAIEFANDRLEGTLGAQILIHPQTIKQLGDTFDDLLAELRYGTIGVNIWSGVGFLLPQLAWGAHPGHTLDNIESGIGVVHNALLLDNTQKNVVYGPFWESPRGMLHGYTGILPKPPWFVTNKTAATTNKRLTDFYIQPSIAKLPGIFASALLG